MFDPLSSTEDGSIVSIHVGLEPGFPSSSPSRKLLRYSCSFLISACPYPWRWRISFAFLVCFVFSRNRSSKKKSDFALCFE